MNAPNMQNLPQDNKFRNCFVASPGYSWISIDYSAQELRLMADGSKEPGFMTVLNAGEDLHCYAGSMMFKRPITKADKDLRNKAKTINFGKPYGMGPNKLADTLSIELEEAENLFRLYAESFPKLNAWLSKQGKFAKEHMYSLTFAPSKRRRWYPDMQKARQLRATVQEGDKETWKEIMIIEGQTERNGMNHPIQGTGADITKEALVGIRTWILEYNKKYNKEVARLLCTVHDQIDVEVIDELAQEFADVMKKIMITCGNKYVQDVNMEVDVTITKEWTK
jgi:DNA polymerase-1